MAHEVINVDAGSSGVGEGAHLGLVGGGDSFGITGGGLVLGGIDASGPGDLAGGITLGDSGEGDGDGSGGGASGEDGNGGEGVHG